MSRYFGAAFLMVTLSLTVTSQPLIQQDPSKHTDFIWNSRKIGNKKVATLTIRKDEERDRRSITPLERDDIAQRNGNKRHAHRHHHGEAARTALWLTNERSLMDIEGERTSDALDSKRTSHRDVSPPLYVAESSVEDGHRVRHNDVHPEGIQGKDHMPTFPEMLGEGGISLKPSLLRSNPRNLRQGTSDGKRKRNNKKGKRNRTPKRNRNNRHKRKKQKGCRRLKGITKRRCLDALRQCRKLKKQKKKKCREDARQNALGEASSTREEPDVFNFLTNITEMKGEEACHYHHLKMCSVGLFSEGSDSNRPVVKCHYRKEFIECMQRLQQRETCNKEFHMEGDMTTLRKRIKEFVWTPSSCLISDVVEGSMQD